MCSCIFYIKISVCSFITSRKLERMEKWKVGVSIFRQICHFSPVLWEEKLGRVKSVTSTYCSFNTVKWTWRSFYIQFLCFWTLLRLDRWPVALCPVWLIINYCAFDRLCLQCLMQAAFEYEIWDLPVWQVVLYRMWNKV